MRFRRRLARRREGRDLIAVPPRHAYGDFVAGLPLASEPPTKWQRSGATPLMCRIRHRLLLLSFHVTFAFAQFCPTDPKEIAK